MVMTDVGAGLSGAAKPSDAAQAAARSAAAAKARDIRLDFFRGVGMFIILIAHIPWNFWQGWIPARFGYSDATEIFVFCSGAASAMAFWTVFDRKGWVLGASRIAWRVWQIYWCHVGVFFATLAVLIVIDRQLETDGYYVRVLNLTRFVNDPETFLVPLFTMSYVPNGLDILPMYVVILVLLPVVAGLAMIRPLYAILFCVGLYLMSSQPWLVFSETVFYAGQIPIFTGLNLPADPIGDRTWFFNPFAWQLVFFTGFAFAAGWLPAPPISRRLMWAAGIFLLVTAPLDPDGAIRRNLWIFREEGWLFGLIDTWPIMRTLDPIWNDLRPLFSKTFFGVLRFVHFLALAYLVWALAGEMGRNLPSKGVAGRVVTIVRRVGQQSLAVFIAQVVIARVLGALIYEWNKGELAYGEMRRADTETWSVVAVNLFGFALLIAVAYIARYFRSQPWRDRPQRAA